MLKIFLITIFAAAFCFSGFAQEQKPKMDGAGAGNGRGSGEGTQTTENTPIKQTEKPVFTPKTNIGLKIVSKPRAIYTDSARQNMVQGKVVLRVTFKKDGEIGKIKVVKGLPRGLSQNAVEAARKIKFEPQIGNGKPVTVTKNIEYNFTIY